MFTTPSFLLGRGVEPHTNFSKSGGLDRILTRKKGGDLFEGEGCNFYIKNKLKSEIFNGKRSLMAKKIFSVS